MIIFPTEKQLKKKYEKLLPLATAGDPEAMVELALVCERLDRPNPQTRRDEWLAKAATLGSDRAKELIKDRALFAEYLKRKGQSN